jgi:hypothetical protein
MLPSTEGSGGDASGVVPSAPRAGARSTRSTSTKVAILSTESIASSSSRSAGVAEPCASCGGALAADQRYCLECGERRTPMSSVLLGGPPGGGDSQPQAASAPFAPPRVSVATGAAAQRGNTVTVIAGVGVLLLAMGVGVLIGRAGNSKLAAPAQQVITVAPPGGATTGGATTTPTTPTTTTPEVSSKGGSPLSKNGGAKKGASGAGSSKGGGSGGGKTPAATPKSSSPGGSSGKSFEEKSKNLPNVVETG